MNANDILVVDNLGKTYTSATSSFTAIERLDFTIKERKIVSIVGPSGAGKTTLLKCLCGLMAPTVGTSSLSGEVIKSPPRELALVFQDYSRSLLPWKTVFDNVVLPIEKSDLGKAERKKRVEDSLAAVGLAKFAHSYPWELSGGMQQRVAIARALAYQPRLLVMDEPFASVDAQTRADLEDLVLQLREQNPITILFVTHDIDEAVYLSDQVIVLSSSPATVLETIDIDIPQPRSQTETRAHPNFPPLRNRIYELLKG